MFFRSKGVEISRFHERISLNELIWGYKKFWKFFFPPQKPKKNFFKNFYPNSAVTNRDPGSWLVLQNNKPMILHVGFW
jgi:hypothetical protein